MICDNVGRVFVIVFDDEVIIVFVINGLISGGWGEIVGFFMLFEVYDVVLMLCIGVLFVLLSIIEECIVGLDLGSDVIKIGIESGVVGVLLVLVFMVVIYGCWGVIVSFVFSINMVLVFGVLMLFGVILILSGIVGFIFIMGMVVDVNIFINERIWEESKKGWFFLSVINIGF